MSVLRISHPTRILHGAVAPDGSKSISNRALIALALSGNQPAGWLTRCSSSKDTVILQKLLTQESNLFDAGDAGTSFRFLAAYLALQPGKKILTGSARMLERPCGPLVEALRQLGADIQYMGREGYPPLLIGEGSPGRAREVHIPAGVSSQFLSALLLIAPCLPGGLVLHPEGPVVSRPYIEMTLSLMRYFGAEAEWQHDAIAVAPGKYHPRQLVVEADWSGASYWYALVALASEAELRIDGLFEKSWQGDSVLATMMRHFGVETTFEPQAVVLKKNKIAPPGAFEQDFIACPDLVQTLAVVCAATGTPGVFSGLDTLSIKETDRITALKTELAKVGVRFDRVESGGKFVIHGQCSWENIPRFDTYGDHRMAMAFAALAMRGTIEIENPETVEKSYPRFWEDLAQQGFDIQ